MVAKSDNGQAHDIKALRDAALAGFGGHLPSPDEWQENLIALRLAELIARDTDSDKAEAIDASLLAGAMDTLAHAHLELEGAMRLLDRAAGVLTLYVGEDRLMEAARLRVG